MKKSDFNFLENLVCNSLNVQPLCKTEDLNSYDAEDLMKTIDYNLAHGWDFENDSNLSDTEKEFIRNNF